MVTKYDIQRYRTNARAEQEGVVLYQALASAEQDSHLAELYRRMAEVEQRHATIWADHLRRASATVPEVTPGWRIRMLIWLAQRFGVHTILPFISRMERGTSHSYANQPEAQAAGMPGDERSHARLFRTLRAETRNGLTDPAIAQFEGRHRTTSGNALRAAILGASDGLTTNISLVMGVAGANLAGRTILFTGIAGMLAGALSMAIGEWLSVQSARELYLHQIEVDRQELKEIPELEWIEVLDARGCDYEEKGQLTPPLVRRYQHDEVDLGYRHSRFRLQRYTHVNEADQLVFPLRKSIEPSEIVVTLGLRLSHQDPKVLCALLDTQKQYRKSADPAHRHTGSIFKDPPGTTAQALIEQAGLRGKTRGKARISEQNANYIVNRGGGCANDIAALIVEAHQQVLQQFGIDLALNVDLLGEWSVASGQLVICL